MFSIVVEVKSKDPPSEAAFECVCAEVVPPPVIGLKPIIFAPAGLLPLPGPGYLLRLQQLGTLHTIGH